MSVKITTPGGHSDFMNLALNQAQKAFEGNEVPVGAILVDFEGKIIAKAYNQTISRQDPTAHAEIAAIRKAARNIGNYRLVNTTLYVTVEPCIMCMGAIIHARVSRIIFGAPDPKWGAAGSLYAFQEDGRLNHHPKVIGGIRENECRQLMVDFFKQKRHNASADHSGAL